MAERRTGTVHSAKHKYTSEKTGWTGWDVRFDDGSKETISIPKDVEYRFSEGDKVSYFKGPYGWIIDSKKPEGDIGESSNGSTKSSSKTSKKSSKKGSDYQKKQQYWNDRDNYWKAKEEYEVNVRDPKIEFQSYFNIISNVYAAALPTMNKSAQPSKVSDIDDMVDQIYAKAREIFTRVNPEPEVEEPDVSEEQADEEE